MLREDHLVREKLVHRECEADSNAAASEWKPTSCLFFFMKCSLMAFILTAAANRQPQEISYDFFFSFHHVLSQENERKREYREISVIIYFSSHFPLSFALILTFVGLQIISCQQINVKMKRANEGKMKK